MKFVWFTFAASEKTEVEKEEENKLLDKLVEIVERRNTIINSIEEARLKLVWADKNNAIYSRWLTTNS